MSAGPLMIVTLKLNIASDVCQGNILTERDQSFSISQKFKTTVLIENIPCFVSNGFKCMFHKGCLSCEVYLDNISQDGEKVRILKDTGKYECTINTEVAIPVQKGESFILRDATHTFGLGKLL